MDMKHMRWLGKKGWAFFFSCGLVLTMVWFGAPLGNLQGDYMGCDVLNRRGNEESRLTCKDELTLVMFFSLQ